jgi:hypothetical protein
MNRKWNTGESVDSFWLDIQTQVQYCGLRDEYHTDLILTTVWANNFGDDETRKEFALNPKWTAAQCYQKAKGLEQVRKERSNGVGIVNVVRQSSYKKGGGKSGGGGPTNGARQKPNGGGNNAGRRPATAGPRGVRAASCLNCGFDSHRGGVCPAQGQPCKACGTVGHYAKHCPMRDANAVIVEDHNVRVCNAVQTSWADEVDEESEDDRAATIAVANSKPPAARSQQGRGQTDWQEAEYGIGNRCEVRDGDKWVSGTITGSYVPSGGTRVCAVLVDETNDIWKVSTDNVVVRKKCDRGRWVPVKRPIRGRGPTVQFKK